MAKLLLLTFLFATIAIPVRLSNTKRPRHGFKRMIWWMIGFNLFYLFNLYYIQARVG